MIPQMHYNICKMQDPSGLSQQCQDYWTSNADSHSFPDQYHFCQRFSNYFKVNSACLELTDV